MKTIRDIFIIIGLLLIIVLSYFIGIFLPFFGESSGERLVSGFVVLIGIGLFFWFVIWIDDLHKAAKRRKWERMSREEKTEVIVEKGAQKILKKLFFGGD